MGANFADVGFSLLLLVEAANCPKAATANSREAANQHNKS
jgi:hypothetical protein